MIIKGGSHTDARGKLEYINDFDLSKVKRLYKTTHFDTETIRAWQVHEIETKWFHCIKGSFEVKIANLETGEVKEFILTVNEPTVLHVPKGNANGFKALEDNSQFMIFSDLSLEEAKEDNERLEVGAFGEEWGLETRD